MGRSFTNGAVYVSEYRVFRCSTYRTLSCLFELAGRDAPFVRDRLWSRGVLLMLYALAEFLVLNLRV